MTETYYIYFAGDLFNHKDLIGNLLFKRHCWVKKQRGCGLILGMDGEIPAVVSKHHNFGELTRNENGLLFTIAPHC